MHTMRRTRLLAAAVAAAVAAVVSGRAQTPAPPAPQQAPLTFKVEVNYVEIDLTVTDAQGTPVRDLTREDVEVLEEGRPQTVTVFSRVDIPVERPDPPLFRASAVEPDVRSNRREFDGRVFVLLLDDLHTSFTRTGRVRAAATQFVERYIGANDLVAVVPTSGASGGAQEFTISRARLLDAIGRFAGMKLPSATLGDSRPRREEGLAQGLTDDAARAHQAGRLLGSVRGVADFLSGIRGRRKAVVLFSEGVDIDLLNFQNRFASDVSGDLKAAIAAATRANVSIYAIDPRGLAGLEDAIELQRLPDDPGAGGMAGLMNELRLSQDSLRVLAEETGGVAAVNRNDYRESFERIVRDNSSYYVLGYYSDNTRRDGRFRPVEVKARRPGLVVRARKGYTAPRGNAPAVASGAAAGTSPELRDALASPVPLSGLPLAASAVPFRAGKDASVLVIVEVDGSKIQFVEKDGKPVTEIEVVMAPFDASGKVRLGGRDSLVITPRPQTRRLLETRGVRVTRRLDLPAGRYSVRIGAREPGGAAGTVLLDVDVPDFAKGPLAMSGLALASAAAGQTPTARADEQLKDILPQPPTVVRTFARSDVLTLFAEIYDHIRGPHKVEIATTVTAEDGRAVISHTDTRGSDELRARGDGFGHVRTIPLADLTPGRYVARVEARGLVSDGGSAARDLEFTVR